MFMIFFPNFNFLIFLLFVFQRFSRLIESRIRKVIPLDVHQIQWKEDQIEEESSNGKNYTISFPIRNYHPSFFTTHLSFTRFARETRRIVEQIFDSSVMGHKFSWPPRNGITLKHASSALVQTDRATCIYILFAYLRQI